VALQLQQRKMPTELAWHSIALIMGEVEACLVRQKVVALRGDHCLGKRMHLAARRAKRWKLKRLNTRD
jgi:hypothetical protein